MKEKIDFAAIAIGEDFSIIKNIPKKELQI